MVNTGRVLVIGIVDFEVFELRVKNIAAFSPQDYC